MVQKEIGVEQTLTMVKIKDVRKGLLIVWRQLEEDRGVVEDEVDASPLLHHSRSISVGISFAMKSRELTEERYRGLYGAS